MMVAMSIMGYRWMRWYVTSMNSEVSFALVKASSVLTIGEDLFDIGSLLSELTKVQHAVQSIENTSALISLSHIISLVSKMADSITKSTAHS